jgi:acyl transferase domain-containing protein/NAD(P)H-dependent flavin oxidoreductase YrpB (nitropropane dioxygenase family)/NAD(P)-dependent dehydrogenase (short-subunit alcohol dehydrogenase family)/acyl carrier protein
MNTFDILVTTLPTVGAPSVAIAASRAGETGIIDVTGGIDATRAAVLFSAMDRHARTPWGIRIDADDKKRVEALLACLPETVKRAIVTTSSRAAAVKLIARLHERSLQAMLEITHASMIPWANEAGVDAVVARGNEAWGWVGTDSAFVLAQRLLESIDLPVFVCGGIGERTIGACIAAGAAGVVLDAQACLTRESLLPSRLREALSKSDGAGSRVLGESLGASFRLYASPGNGAVEELEHLEHELYEAETTKQRRIRRWKEAVYRHLSLERADAVMPAGQEVLFAEALARKYTTVGGMVQSLRKKAGEHIAAARKLEPLGESSALAREHGTRFPIVQGPMTGISDSLPFAQEVLQAGALPMLALGMSRGEHLETLLHEAHDRFGHAGWGVGVLGFLGQELRDEQMRLLSTYTPACAIIAGGRPEQARELEQRGISAYIHVPTPRLLEMFIGEGQRRFVWEGRESGGHIGPLTSFVLWETMTETLLRCMPQAELSRCAVLFAGGIQDARSAAMVSVIAAPLVEAGVRVGVIAGTAYLRTKEIVATGAIAKTYQHVVLRCTETAVIRSGPGHSVRCAPTPYVDFFRNEKRRLAAEGVADGEIRARLDAMNLERLREAAKGTSSSLADGIHMVGQVASLSKTTTSVRALHEHISIESREYLVRAGKRLGPGRRGSTRRPCDIAIVGMACHMPMATDLESFWTNLLKGVTCVTEIPEKRWSTEIHFDADRGARDKVYSRWGGFMPPIRFDPMRYGMPPSSLRSIEPIQLLTLEAVRAAVEDAGYSSRDFSRDRTSVIVGCTGGLAEMGQNYAVRALLPQHIDRRTLGGVLEQLPEWTEDSFAGLLLNVIAGRVTNRFDFGGVNFAVDAACASSLAGIYLAVKELESGSSDMVIAGGADTFQSPFNYLCFGTTRALSPTGPCRTFDAEADGTCLSEGIAMLVLKRLDDAERDGDRIYAVIKGAGGSSDGRARGLTAPHPAGQARALNRAYEQAGFSPATVGYVEAHGTGTAAGDASEIESLKKVFTDSGAEKASVAVGSLKSVIGHTKGAAGAAGLVKIALSLHRKTLPPTVGIGKPNPTLKDAPVYANTELRPWPAPGAVPRRAGLSGFGFGGTNYHLALEEYTGSFLPSDGACVSKSWPSELLLWRAEDRDTLVHELTETAAAVRDGARPPLSVLAATVARSGKPAGTVKAGIVATSPEDLLTKIDRAVERVKEHRTGTIADPRGIYFSAEAHRGNTKLALLFPGQGAQYPFMLRDLAVYFDTVRRAVESADRTLTQELAAPLSRFIFPPSAYDDALAREQKAALADTRVAQPALGAVSIGAYRLLSGFGIRPDMVGGHSYGEYTALCAAGVIDEEQLAIISAARGRYIVEEATGESGTMAAVEADGATVEEVCTTMRDVWVANLNSPRQTVISGTARGIEEASHALQERGISVRSVAVSCGFHSPLVSPARDRLASLLSDQRFDEARFPVYSNTLAAPYPHDSRTIAGILGDHLIRPVRFAEQIDAMYGEGARIFVEVGPKRILSSLAEQTLEGRHSLVVPLDAKGRHGITQLHHVLAQLAVNGIDVRLERLFEGRVSAKRSVAALLSECRSETPSGASWMVDGGRAWPAGHERPAAPFPTAIGAIEQSNAGPLQSEPFEEPAMKTSTSDNASMAQAHGATAKPAASTQTPHPPEHRPPSAPRHAAGAEGLYAVMANHQRVMDRFLETQRSIMLAYLNEGADEKPSPPLSEATVRKLHASASSLPPLEPGGREGMEAVEALVHPETAPPEVVDAGEESRESVSMERSMAEGIFTEEAIVKTIVEVVGERTGYPPDMLDSDLDLEADLGIDSIKRVEILGALRRRFDLGEPTDDSRRLASSARTLRNIAEWVAATTTGPRAASPSTKTESDSTPTAVMSGGEETGGDVTERLNAIVSDRTGYPVSMLDPDLDLEADLGIDSIKRVEIIGSLRQSTGGAVSIDEDLARELAAARTLAAMATLLEGAVSGLAATPSVSVTPADPVPMQRAAVTVKKSSPRVPRFSLQPMTAMPAGPSREVAGRVFLVTDDGAGVSDALAQKLKAHGAHPLVVRHAERFRTVDDALIEANLTRSDSLHELAEAIQGIGKPIAGIVHLLTLTNASRLDALSAEAWRESTELRVKTLFRLAKILASTIREAGGWICAAITIDGRFGCTGQAAPTFFPGDGGIIGLVNTIAAEWPEVLCKTVDVEPALAADEIGDRIVAELVHHDGDTQIGFRGGERTVIRGMPVPYQDRSTPVLDLNENSVVLVTGGARGITAEIAKEFSTRFRPRIILVGRSAWPDAESERTASVESPMELKKALAERLTPKGGKPNLAAIEAAYQRLMRERQMRRNREEMERAGATVGYYQADVGDHSCFCALIERIRDEHGTIDVVVHGAGIIEDKLIEDKPLETFDRVFDTKADSCFTLAKALRPDTLKALCLFSSVSRFGSPGQCDYTAANDVVNKMARYLDQLWPCRVLSVIWGPWGETGMASPEVQKKLRSLGVQIVPTARGRAWLLEELLYGRKGEVEVILGDGPWELSPREVLSPVPDALPMLANVTAGTVATGGFRADKLLDPAVDTYLCHHVMDGKPVMPLCGTIELMAELCSRQWPGNVVRAFEDHRFFKGIVLDEGARTIRLDGTERERTGEWIGIDLKTTEPSGRLYNSARAVLAPAYEEAPRFDPAQIAGLRPFDMSVEEAYERCLFHGPCFQGITAIDGIGHQGILATVESISPKRCIRGKSGNEWLVDPIVLDCGLQLAIVWLRVRYDMTPLPSNIGAIRFYGSLSRAPLRCFVRTAVSGNGQTMNATILYFDEDERIVAVMENVEFWGSTALNRVTEIDYHEPARSV